MSSQPTFSITPLKPCLPFEASTEVSFMLRVGCPPREFGDGPARPRLNLVLAIDRSGSMGGKPIREAVRCACKVIEALEVGDRISVVAYDNNILTVVAATEVTADRATMLRAVQGIQARGGTNLHAGWLAGAGEAAGGIQPDVITRVLLLSDGQANQGVTDVEEIARQAAALCDAGIATSTIGLGANFNEDMMTALARAGGGQSSYGETVEDLWPSFESELGLLSATAGREVTLTLFSPCGGHVTVEGVRDLGNGKWRLSDLVHGAQTSAIVRVSVSDLPSGQVAILDAGLSWTGMDGTVATIETSLRQNTLPLADFVMAPSDPDVAARVLEVEASALQAQAALAARAHDFATVGGIADKMAAMAPGNAWIGGMASTLKELATNGDSLLISKEAVYASSKLSSTYTSSTTLSGDALPEYLRRRTRQGDSATSTS